MKKREQPHQTPQLFILSNVVWMTRCSNSLPYREESFFRSFLTPYDIFLKCFPSTRNMIKEEWYFNTGCSWHMMGSEHILTDLRPFCQGSVIFGDGARGRVIRMGSLVLLALSKLKNALLVEGLTVNLVNVSQLCDEGLIVQFTKVKS